MNGTEAGARTTARRPLIRNSEFIAGRVNNVIPTLRRAVEDRRRLGLQADGYGAEVTARSR